MILIDLDRRSATPLHRQIVERTRETIASGALLPGERLPSTRALAARLGVHRSTVALAYQELWSLGFVELRQGARPRVRARREPLDREARADEGLIDWAAASSPAASEVWRQYRLFPARAAAGGEGASSICFARIDMDPRLFPLERFRSCLNRALARRGSELLSYGEPRGYLALREALARRLEQHGIVADLAEILLTNGSQQAADLLLRVIGRAGRAVAVEAPTYDHLLPLLSAHGLRPIEVPLRHDGLDLDLLEETLAREEPCLVYTMPSFQNPTGLTTSQAHRERLLSLCEAHRVPLFEDGYDEEMQYSGKVVLAIKSMDRNRVVVYSGTFSKVLFPGARVGWVVAHPECIERMVAVRHFAEIAPNAILQAALHEFLARGFFDQHVSRMHRVFRKRMRTALDALRTHVDPRWARWTEPRGGYLIWLSPRPVPDAGLDWCAHLASHGIEVAAGHFFYSSSPAHPHLRLSISTLNEEEIEAGVRRLAAGLREIYG